MKFNKEINDRDKAWLNGLEYALDKLEQENIEQMSHYFQKGFKYARKCLKSELSYHKKQVKFIIRRTK